MLNRERRRVPRPVAALAAAAAGVALGGCVGWDEVFAGKAPTRTGARSSHHPAASHPDRSAPDTYSPSYSSTPNPSSSYSSAPSSYYPALERELSRGC